MEKGDKDSPGSGRNIFDNAANMMGMSPFGLSFGAHLAHMPHMSNAYSLLQHHPAFPVSSLFGGLAEGAFGHFPPSFSSAEGSRSKSSPSKHSPKSSKSSSRSSKLSRSSSSKTTVTKATTTLATTSTVSTSSSRPTTTTMVSGTTGVSLLSGKFKKSSKHLSSKTFTTSLLAQSTSQKNSANGAVSQSASTSPSPSATSSSSAAVSLSPSTKHKDLLKTLENGATLYESDNPSNGSLASNGLSSDEEDFTGNGQLGNDRDMDSNDEGGNDSIDGRNTGSPNIHIDGTKKRLIADQIRQRVQNKPIQNIKPSIMQPMKRGRGRPPKHEPTPTPQQLEVIKEYKKQQEYLKRQLEENLKQQQMQLKMMKHSQVEKEKEASAKVQKLLEASVKQARANAAAGAREKEAKHQSALSPPLFPKEASSRSATSQGNSTVSRSDKSDQDVHPSTSKGSPVKLKHLSEESSGLSEDNDSDMMNDSDDEDDSGINETDSDAEPRLKMVIDSESDSHEAANLSKGAKRSADESSEKNETPTKRPRVQMDEKELKIPMDAGWRRQTTILAIGKRGFIGEVLYFAPCGKKMKTIPDVMRYVDRHSITGMGRENFSFNTKVNVGDFYETRHGHNGVVKLTNDEVVERMALVESKRQKMLRYKQQRGRKRMEKQNKQLQLAKQMMDQKLKRKMDQQVEMARRASEYKVQKRVEKDRQKDMANKVKQIKAIEQKKQKEQLNLIREQEKMQRHEQMRIERELRAQQILESNLMWYHMEREREMKRQQSLMMKEQERERKRQHILLVKAMEAQKKQERDRLKEEKVVEKRMVRERKMEQKRWELQMARELKKPTEDMELRDSRPLPEYPRIPGIQTDSAAFADILMVLEFLHNFADALGYDKDTLPTLRGLQDGILGKTEEDSEDYVSLVSHLLRYAISDPGVPNPKEAVTKLGQKIVDMEITDSIVSEILRIFVVARNGGSNEMSDWLSQLPLESLDHIRKAAILAFLCNELLCGKSISSEIEKHLDRMGDIRRDKWVVEGKLRRLRVLQAKKFHRPVSKPVSDLDSSAQGPEGDESQNTSGMNKRCSDDEEEKEEESGNDSDDDAQSGCQETDGDEEEPLSLEECDKQLEKLQKQHAQYRAKVFKSSHKLRAIMVGSDRYRRKYWVLPCAGGVFVEGLETGKSVEDEDLKEEVQEIKEEIVEIKTESEEIKEEEKMECENSNLNGSIVKEEKCEDEKMTIKTDKPDIKSEATTVKSERKEDRNVWDTVKEEGLDKGCSLSTATKMEVDEEKNECKSETGQAAIVTSALFPTSWKMDKHKQTTCNGEITPTTSVCNNKLDCSVKSSSNIFLQSPSSSKLSDLCSSESSAISPSKSEGKSDDSKSVVNNSLLTSPSPLITPYSSAPSLFFPPFSPSLNGALGSNPSTSSLSPGGSSPRPAHQHQKSSTPSHTEGKASFLSIDTLLKKDHSHLTSQNNHFLQSPLFPVSPDQMIKSLSSSTDGEQKPWFSILPRMPCDDLSMTQGSSPQVGLSTSPFSGASPFFSPMSLRAFPLHSPSFSSFQMGQLYSPNNYSATTASTNTSCDSPSKLNDSSFKVPLTPKVEMDTWASGGQQQESTEAILKELQGERQPIPEDMKKSWWRVTDPEQLRTLQRHCHPRGIREKNLQKSFQKYMDYACDSCSKGNKEIVSLESDSSEEEEDEEEEEEGEKEGDGQEKKEKESDEKEVDDEEKSKKKKAKETPPPPQKEWLPEIAHQVELSVLEEVENLVERVASASLQGWKVPSRVDDDTDLTIVDRTKLDLKENERYPLDAAREKLLSLEPNIERRYIKPPLTKAVTINLASLAEHTRSERRNSHTQEEEDDNDSIDQEAPERPEDVPPGLATWRSAVAKATSPAQLTLCVHQLSTSISWEKSIMKVLCQICRKDDNEAELLLCDGCDQGYHTYCFKPKMDNIPDGDWYCYECISKASGVPCCIVCGKKTGKIAECHHCPRAIHLDCLDPPLPRMPRKWVCPACSSNMNGRKRTRKSPKSPKKCDGGNTTPIQRRDSEASTKQMETPSSEKKKGNKENERKKAAEQSDDMTLCRLVLTEMEKHEDGWPFLKPVNFKQFPTYRKYIKQPMDFSTIKNKLRDSVYKSRAEFAADCRLIFENCKTFNEDESEVGRGGHTLRKFFESRWKELILHSSTVSSHSSSSSSSAASPSPAVTVPSSSSSSVTSVNSSSSVAPPLSSHSSGTLQEASVSETTT